MAKKDEKIKEEAAEDAEEVVEEEAAEEVEEVLEEVKEEPVVEEAERPWTKKYNPDTGLYDTVYLD